MRRYATIALSLAMFGQSAIAQRVDTSRVDTSGVSKTLFNRRDLAISGIALIATGAVSHFDPEIARASQRGRRSDPVTHEDLDGLTRFSTKVSHVNETTLTAAGIVAYGAGRLFHSPLVTDVALHAAESVVIASVASQIIRGPLGRTRPYVSHDSDQYKFKPFRGFFGDSTFDYRSFPSIHTSSSMAIATVLTMEIHRRDPGATPFVAPVLFAAGMLPGLVRIRLDQHWTSDVVSGAFMGVLAGYKVVSYSHAHPDNRFDRLLNTVSIKPEPDGRMLVMLSPEF